VAFKFGSWIAHAAWRSDWQGVLTLLRGDMLTFGAVESWLLALEL